MFSYYGEKHAGGFHVIRMALTAGMCPSTSCPFHPPQNRLSPTRRNHNCCHQYQRNYILNTYINRLVWKLTFINYAPVRFELLHIFEDFVIDIWLKYLDMDGPYSLFPYYVYAFTYFVCASFFLRQFGNRTTNDAIIHQLSI